MTIVIPTVLELKHGCGRGLLVKNKEVNYINALSHHNIFTSEIPGCSWTDDR